MEEEHSPASEEQDEDEDADEEADEEEVEDGSGMTAEEKAQEALLQARSLACSQHPHNHA